MAESNGNGSLLWKVLLPIAISCSIAFTGWVANKQVADSQVNAGRISACETRITNISDNLNKLDFKVESHRMPSIDGLATKDSVNFLATRITAMEVEMKYMTGAINKLIGEKP